MSNVQLESLGPRGFRILVNGFDISSAVSAFTFVGSVRQPSTLRVIMPGVSVIGDVLDIDVMPRLRDCDVAALVALGWTPPKP